MKGGCRGSGQLAAGEVAGVLGQQAKARDYVTGTYNCVACAASTRVSSILVLPSGGIKWFA